MRILAICSFNRRHVFFFLAVGSLAVCVEAPPAVWVCLCPAPACLPFSVWTGCEDLEASNSSVRSDETTAGRDTGPHWSPALVDLGLGSRFFFVADGLLLLLPLWARFFPFPLVLPISPLVEGAMQTPTRPPLWTPNDFVSIPGTICPNRSLVSTIGIWDDWFMPLW